MKSIRKRWWFLARLTIIFIIIIGLFFGTGLNHKTGAIFLWAIILFIFAWAYACTFAQLRIDYGKWNKRRRNKFE